MSRTFDALCCGSQDHGISRRGFLQGATALGASLGGMSASYNALWAKELRQQKKQVLLLWLAGGASQIETWDPKPGHVNGGPFLSIPTSVPGVQISELLPNMAKRMDRTAIIRSLDTRIGDHGGGANLLETGRTPEPGLIYPNFGSVIAKELAERESQVPDFVSLYLATEGHRVPDPGFLGGRYSPIHLRNSLKPENIDLPQGLSQSQHAEREHLRAYLSERFNRSRDAMKVKGYNSTYARVKGLMRSDEHFNIENEPQQVRDRYGKTDFGQHCLIARRLLEAGVPMVKVARAWWDSHGENFESHRELVTELDKVMSTLLEDLEASGLLESTLVITLSEFGRTPKINRSLGRDHFARAWSCSLTGTGIRGGAVHGATSDDGQEVSDGKMNAGDLFATIYKALGIDPHKHYYLGARPVPLAPEDAAVADTVLA